MSGGEGLAGLQRIFWQTVCDPSADPPPPADELTDVEWLCGAGSDGVERRRRLG